MSLDADRSAARELERFREQERLLVLLNLSVLAVLIAVHAAFVHVLGLPSRSLVSALGGYLVLQVIALAWMQGITRPPSAAVLRAYGVWSVWATIAFAFVASSLRRTVDSHYPVLMVPAIIAAGFRFSLGGTLAVVTVAVALTFYEPYAYFQKHPPAIAGEYFEAVTVSLIHVVVGLVVWSIAGLVRRDRARIEANVVELEQTRDRLVTEEKLAAVGRLASSIAHEIRNPVAMISSSLAAAMADSADAGTRAKMFAIAGSEAGRLERLTEEFLDYARPRTPERVRTGVEPLLAYAASVVEARAREREIAIAVEPIAGLGIDCDPFQMHQALLNLLMNALDAAPAASTVRLGAEDCGTSIALFVENRGDAIPDDAVPRLFEPFFTRKPKGTGLGLAVARNIARAHGGDLELASNTAERIRFRILVPRVGEA